MHSNASLSLSINCALFLNLIYWPSRLWHDGPAWINMHLLMASCDKLILGETIEVTGESVFRHSHYCLCLQLCTFRNPSLWWKGKSHAGIYRLCLQCDYTDCCQGGFSCGLNKVIGMPDVFFPYDYSHTVLRAFVFSRWWTWQRICFGRLEPQCFHC